MTFAGGEALKDGLAGDAGVGGGHRGQHVDLVGVLNVQRGSTADHDVGAQYLAYHNDVVAD